MNQYELLVLLNPDIGGDATKKRLDEVRKLITSQKGELFYEDEWGLRDLAYNIKGHDRGYYALFNFNCDPQEGDLKEIDTTCRLEKDILRHMMIKLPASYEPKSYAVLEEDNDDMTEKKEAPAKKATVKKAAPKKTAEPKKEEEPTRETKEEQPKAAEKKEKESGETSLEDVDAKLKSIIDNPDLNF